MQSTAPFSLQNAHNMTLDEAGKAQLHSLADAYPYFVPLQALRRLIDDEGAAVRELPHVFGINPVSLHYWAAKLKTVEAIPEPAAAEAVAAGSEPELPELPETEPVPSQPEELEATEPAAAEATNVETEAEIVAEPEAPVTETDPEPVADAETKTPEPVSAAPVPRPEDVPASKSSIGIAPMEGIAPMDTDPAAPADEPVIQPLFTKDYFKHQGVSIEEDVTTFELKKPSGNDLMVMRSFGEWLRFFHSKRVKDDEEQEDKKALKAMWQKGKLAAALEEEDEEIPEVVFEMAVKSISHEGNPATETMAKIYLGQGKWEKAIGVYEQLQLRNPQKSTYFAEKIAAIEQQHRP